MSRALAPARAGTRRRYTPRVPAPARRDQVLDAALHIIVRDGYRAVSIDAIARELDVTRPVVYHVFDGLPDLLHALLDRQEQRALQQVMATISAVPDARAGRAHLRSTIERLAAMIGADPMTWTPVLLAAVDTPAAVRDRIAADRELVRARLQLLIEMAVGQRSAARLDPVIVSHALLALAEYFGRLILHDPAAVSGQQLASTVTDLLWPAPARRAAES